MLFVYFCVYTQNTVAEKINVAKSYVGKILGKLSLRPAEVNS
jgi:hypothetical protein